MSLTPGADAMSLAVRALRSALADASMEAAALDGLLVGSSQGIRPDRISVALARRSGLDDLRLLEHIDMKGLTALAMIQHAALAVRSGAARNVMCVFADAPLREGGSAGSTYAASGGNHGLRGLERAAGMLGSVPTYALMASRYLTLRKATDSDLCAVALAHRSWAVHNPDAVMRTPLTEQDYRESRMIAEPLRVLDCARPVNGAAAVLVADASARTFRQSPVHIRASDQAHPVRRRRAGEESWVDFDGVQVRKAVDDVLRSAGRKRSDIDCLQLYDPFSVVTLHLLESYGFCAPGEAGAFVRAGGTAPGGDLPTNTGGGQLSGFYLQGMTPLIEGIIQLRGTGGSRQVPDASSTLVTALGGRLDHHGLLVLDREPA